MRRISFALLGSILSFSWAFTQPSLDSLGISVTGASRQYSFTNKESAFLYGETNAPNAASWEGFNVLGHEYLDDYTLIVDGHPLERNTAVTTVYPDFLVRKYPGGILEEVRLVDSLALMAVTITCPSIPVEFIPWVTDGHSADEFVHVDSGATQYLARARHQVRTQSEDFPVWMAVRTERGIVRHDMQRKGQQCSPFSLYDTASTHHVFVVAVGDGVPELRGIVAAYLANPGMYHSARRMRMEHLLQESNLVTDDKRLNKAIAWAKLSLDALMMHQQTYGIFAGLPWFNNFWGRDTFIALPGATLVTGRFHEAKTILNSFAGFQQCDTSSTDYGRIPNFVNTTDRAYNTADGTPRFVMMAKEYVIRSGDTSFISTLYPVIVRAAEGTLRYHTDSLGFLVHRDAETWMDAVGPDGPWSPRGNRANDVQALWIHQLEASVWFAQRMQDTALAAKWNQCLLRCSTNFQRYFVNSEAGRVSDHLRTDGTPDSQLRPNQIIAASLLDEGTRAKVLRLVTTKLAYEYGVASLSQDDDNFHPFHQHEPYYPKDAAYHNGTVWTWLQGPLITELCRAGYARTAFRITKNSVHQILDRGAVGTLAELVDAVPHPGEAEPRLSGTFSQAWSLAEFIRNAYDDYLGVRLDRLSRTLTLSPHFPTAVARVEADIPSNNEHLHLSIDAHPGTKTIILDGRRLTDTLFTQIDFPGNGGMISHTLCILPPSSQVKLILKGKEIVAERNGAPFPSSTWFRPSTIADSLIGTLSLATPVARPGLQALRGPAFPLLPNTEIRRMNPRATKIVDATDPAYDDKGDDGYTYPRSSLFVPGSFDITRFSLSVDSVYAYFRMKFTALSDPGWHPEYGSQLTFAAIAIDEDGVAGSGRRDVPLNSGMMLAPGRGYERIIFVGGGLRVEDQHGTTLAAYLPVPEDAAHPMGNADSATISFALPLQYLGTPDSLWHITVLVGGQDDHGGAGIGEFRTVNAEAGEMAGGGRKRPDESNVYDIMECTLRKP